MPKIDSLKRELRNVDKQPDRYAKDTLLYRAIRAVMRAYGDVNVDSAFHYNKLLIKLCTEKKLPQQLVYAHYYTGILYQIKGDNYKAIQAHYKALAMAQKLQLYAQMAASYGQLAHAFSTLNNKKKALALCQQGLAILRKCSLAESYHERLTLLNALGVVYREQGDLARALNVNQEMYALGRNTPNQQWYEAQGLHAIGLVYRDLGELTKAVDYHKKALVIARKNGSVELEVNILVNTAALYIQQKNWPRAIDYCNEAKQIARRANNSRIVAEADEKLYIIYRQTRQWDKALAAYESFVSLRDSLSKETNQQRIDLLQAQYTATNALQQEKVRSLEQQNRDEQTRNGLFGSIAVVVLVAGLLFGNNRRLQGKNREIDRQRALLETARAQLTDINKTLESRVEARTQELVIANQELIRKNEEIKEALFKGQTIERKRVALELHDNLSSLLSAINMSIQAINPHNLSESQQSVYQNVKQLIQNAYAEVRNISHNILPAELGREGLAPTLTRLISQLNQNSALHFSLTITGLQERLPVEIEFNVYSIVWELINNAIRHAQASTVDISLFKTDIGVNLSVIDDGIGMGQHPDKWGVGLQNIQTRLDSLGGTFNALLPTEKGTRILIKIPIETSSIEETVRANEARIRAQ